MKLDMKAFYYAISRTLVPTVIVCIFLLFWQLDVIKTWNFLTSDRLGAKILRVFLLLVETLWFLYLYYDMLDKIEKQEELILAKGFMENDFKIEWNREAISPYSMKRYVEDFKKKEFDNNSNRNFKFQERGNRLLIEVY